MIWEVVIVGLALALSAIAQNDTQEDVPVALLADDGTTMLRLADDSMTVGSVIY